MSPKACIACGAEASLLCDFPLGGRAILDESGIKPRIFNDADQMPHTCDAPLCQGCAKHVSNVFVCGNGGGHESVDHCPAHAGMAQPRLEPITPMRAEAMRREIHAGLRRRRFAVV